MIQQQEINENVESTKFNISFVVVLLGSHALDVWGSSSDVDCLVIGALSPMVFFALIAQKLRRPEHQDLKMLRKIQTGSDTIIKMKAGGVRFNLQYCAATRVAER